MPADLIASIPAFLGFYPSNSLVMVALNPRSTQPGCSRIGPITRADITDGDSVTATLGALCDVGATSAFAFFIGEGKNGDIPDRETAALLHQEASDRNIRILGVWWVPCILSGTPYRILLDTTGSNSHDDDGGWESGVIPDIAANAAVRQLVSGGGMLPAVDRGEALEFFARTTVGLPVDVVERITRGVVDRGTGIVDALCDDHRSSDFRMFLADFVEGLIDETRRLLAEGENLLKKKDLLSGAARLVAHTKARDVVLGVATGPEVAPPLAELMLAVARTFSGDIRCNALCVYTVAVIACGRTTRVWSALRNSYEENPSHRLTGLLLSAYGRGRFDLILESCR